MPASFVPPGSRVPIVHDYFVLIFSFFLTISVVCFPLSSGAVKHIRRTSVDHAQWSAAIFLTPIVCLAAATTGFVWQLVTWRDHHRWLIDRPLSQGLMGAFAGLLCNVFLQYCHFWFPEEPQVSWDMMALVGAGIAGTYMVGFAVGIVMASHRLRQARSLEAAVRRLDTLNPPPQIPEIEKVVALNEMAPPDRVAASGTGGK